MTKENVVNVERATINSLQTFLLTSYEVQDLGELINEDTNIVIAPMGQTVIAIGSLTMKPKVIMCQGFYGIDFKLGWNRASDFPLVGSCGDKP